jgi:hypothetical protein
MELYQQSAFKDLGSKLTELKPKEAKISQLDIVRKNFDDIEDALNEGVEIQQVHKVMKSLGLKVELSTFKTSVAKVRKERLKENRKAQREARELEKISSQDKANNGTSQGKKKTYPKVEIPKPLQVGSAELISD